MKIGRHEYEIVKGDKFLDNGHTVQLLTQSKEAISWGHQPHPSLSKRDGDDGIEIDEDENEI